MAWRAITLVVIGALMLGACGSDDDTEAGDDEGTIVYAVGDAADGSTEAAELASYIEGQGAAWLRGAIDAALAGEQPDPQETPPRGCSVKWRD